MVKLNECRGKRCSLSESARSATSSPRRFYSILKWFKRSLKPSQHNSHNFEETPPGTGCSSVFSSIESVDTFYSTTTVRSFAFRRGHLDGRSHQSINLSIERKKSGPSGDSTLRVVDKNANSLTTTLPANAVSRGGNSITATDSLQSCTGATGSCNYSPTSANRFVYVQGKRHAPNPPIDRPSSLHCEQSTLARRKRRPAPQPPVQIDHSEVDMERATSSTDKKMSCSATLVFQGDLPVAKHPNGKSLGVESSSGAVPRTWHKKKVFEYSTASKNNAPATPSTSHDSHDGCPPNFFASKGKRKDIKRQSGLSILTKISQLDKEATTIVQEEQAKLRAAMLLETSRLNEIERKIDEGNEEVVQDIVTSAMNEHSPRKSTRALISKFNAIGNMSRVTVNTSFFAKRNDIGQVSTSTGEKEKDLGKYFFPFQTDNNHKSNSKPTTFSNSNSNNNNNYPVTRASEMNNQQTIITDVTNRLSSLQEITNKHSSSGNSTSSTQVIPEKSFLHSRKVVCTSSSSSSNKVVEHLAPNTRTFGEKFDKERTSDKVTQREIDSQFHLTNKSRIEEENQNSNKVSKVLDILVQAEKDGRNKGHKPQDKVTDLKEILKEMKHSLPKHPKTKTTVADQQPLVSFPSSSKLVEPLKITQPPVLQVPVSPSKNTMKTPAEKQKVSFGVQTTGNIRKIQSSESPASSAIKRTFHLLRPREFAAIEAIMTMKNHDDDQQENTYSNVIEQSIYANAIVLPSRNNQIIPAPITILDVNNKKQTAPENIVNDVAYTAPVEAMTQEMSTLAINRLMRKLEGAIASGNHQLAAIFAKELAKLKVQCSVIRQKVKTRNLLNVDMFIEDRLAHQGPIPLQLPVDMTVGQLKEKIFNEFQIPLNVQHWIIGKKLADNNENTLKELNAVDGLPIFLYLAAPVFQINNDNEAAGTAADDDKISQEEQENDDKLEMDDDDELSDEDEVNSSEVKIQIPQEQEKEKILEKTPLQTTEVITVEEKEEQGEELDGEDEEEEQEDDDEEAEKDNENSSEGDKDVSDNENGAFGMTEEANMKYKELIMLENCELVLNVNNIECPICFAIYGPMEGVILRDCLHEFCRGCIEETIKYCTEAEIKCPYRDTQYACESTLQQREIRALVEPQVYEQLLAKSISQAENNAGQNAFHCRTANCLGWCIYDDNANNFLCPVCDMTNCLTCRVIHNGKNCWEYQEDVRLSKETDEGAKRTAEMIKDMMDRGEAISCPTCTVILMKKWGCDWLRCSMCKTEICWVTKGPRWGPAGPGDTTGGCKCGLNGVKCHPYCQYCH